MRAPFFLRLGPPLVFVAFLVLALAPRDLRRAPAGVASPPAPSAPPRPAPPAPRADRPALGPVAPAPGRPRSPLADGLNAPGATARDDMRAIGRILELYRERFGAYPAFEHNAQLVNALAGANPDRLGLLPRDAPAVDPESGALLDRWGSPYVFHSLSRTSLEIRAAGPDRVPHSDDDVVVGLGGPAAPDPRPAERPLRTDRPR